MVFQKNHEETTFSRYSHKTPKSEGCEPHLILPKPRIARKRHLLNTCKLFKNRGDTTFQLISTTQISKQKQRFEKTSNFKNRGEATFHRYPQNQIFEKKERRRHSVETCTQIREEATFHRYSQPNEQRSDIPSILVIPFSREATLSRYLHF